MSDSVPSRSPIAGGQEPGGRAIASAPTAHGRLTFLTGASSGLGEALAPLLARDGDTVILAARRLEKLEALAQRIRDGGGRAFPVALDVADAGAVARVLGAVQAEHGPVDRLICNAGIGDPMPVAKFEAARIERIFRTNFFGAMCCIEAVLPQMIERRTGHIVGVSSLAGYRGLPANPGYAASKAALTVALESLRIELSNYGIAVTTISPGFVKTPLTAKNRHPMPFLMELEDAARLMHEAITEKVTHTAFPWQLASIMRASRLLPDALYDRALRHRKADKG